MSKSRIFLFLLLSFIGGVFVRSFFEISNLCLLFFIISAIILLVIFYKNPKVTMVAFMLLSFSTAIWKTDGILQKVNNAELAGKIIEGEATVLKNADSTFGQNVTVQFSKEKIKVLLQIPQYPEFRYGDVMEIKCELKKIENKNSEFDWRMQMAKDGILYSCENKKYQINSSSGGNIILRNIIKLKDVLENNINNSIPLPEGALASGILFGGSGGLSKEIQNDFSRTGMTHIVAVSGYNVTIIAEYLILLGIFLGLWRKQAIWFAIIGIVVFVFAIGFPASAVRAGVMSSIVLWAIKHGRLASSENAIILAGATMLFINPLLLGWDVGFQLSFLATLGIVLTSPLWDKSFIKKHKAFGITEMIILSLSAQVFVLPVIVYNFHSASVISLLANVLILPIVPLSMLLVFLASLFGSIFIPLATIFAWLSYVTLHYEILVIRTLSHFSWASLQMENVSVWFVIIYYIILAGALIYLNRYQKQCKVIEK